MSTLKTNTIQHLTSGFNNIVTHTDGAGTVNAAHCRAWVNFNGTSTVAIRAQFNVSSITDSGTGQYVINFNSALSDANYAITGLPGQTGGGAESSIQVNDGVTVPSTTSFPIRITTNDTLSYVDRTYVFLSIFR